MISLDFLILQILHSGSQILDPRLAVNGEGGRGEGGSDPFTSVRERGNKKTISLGGAEGLMGLFYGRRFTH